MELVREWPMVQQCINGSISKSLFSPVSLFRIFICIFIGWAFELHLMDHSDVAAIQTNHPQLRVLAGGLKGFPL
jgi:hypothetical protein